MPHKTSRMTQQHDAIHALRRPSVGSLLGHILSSTISNATVTLFIAGSAILGVMLYYNAPVGDYFMLLLACIAILAFLQGCTAWQADLNRYQKSLAEARHHNAHHR